MALSAAHFPTPNYKQSLLFYYFIPTIIESFLGFYFTHYFSIILILNFHTLHPRVVMCSSWVCCHIHNLQEKTKQKCIKSMNQNQKSKHMKKRANITLGPASGTTCVNIQVLPCFISWALGGKSHIWWLGKCPKIWASHYLKASR